MRSNRRSRRGERKGAASVEFALVAPVLVTIVLGVSEASRLFDIQNQLSIAAREGARLAAMDRTGMLGQGQTTNQKITEDIENFLTSNGLPGDKVDVFIVDPVDSTTPFDLDEPTNDLELFELRIELPYSEISGLSGPGGSQLALSAKVVFRNARAAIVQ